MALHSTAARLTRPWRELTDRERRRALLAGAMLLALAAQIPAWMWVVDDAGISFSYARSLAEGHGLVAQPGAERVEGYSNPLWVVLLSLWELAGVGGFVASKVMGVVFGMACIPLVWRIARWSRPDRDEMVPLLAAYALALNAIFAIWNTSGLENSLFNVLLAAGAWRVLVEIRTRGFPWSGLLFAGVALTRPEGALYALAAGAAAAIFARADGRGRRPAYVWLLVFGVPFLAVRAASFHYFAWPLPNTYYAKLSGVIAAPLDWSGRGWTYLRAFAGWSFRPDSPGPGLGFGSFLPLFVLGAVGSRGWRGRVAGGLLAALLAALWLPLPEDGQALRVIALGALTASVPFLAADRPGGRALALCWLMAGVSILFTLQASGDWMHGYRWMSLLAVPTSVLFAAGVGELRDALGRSWRAARVSRSAVLAPLALAVWVVPQLRHLAWFTWDAPIGVTTVRHRVDYVHDLMDTLHLEEATVLDVDMGAALYWSRTQLVDLVGLIDVPMARHPRSPAFYDEYLFRERRPEFAHVHGSWIEKSRIAESSEWREQYLPLPGYLTPHGTVHTGEFVRRDLLFSPDWRGQPGLRVSFANGVTLEGWELPGLPTAPGLEIFVTVGLSGADSAATQLEIFLAGRDGVAARRRVAPGYGWLEPEEWPDGGVFVGRFTLPIAVGTPPGSYDLGFVLRDRQGLVVPAIPDRRSTAPTAAAVIVGPGGGHAAVAAGEARFPAAVEVEVREQLAEHNRADLASVARRARDLDCSRAEAGWLALRRRFAGRPRGLAPARPEVQRALAECWARRAGGSIDPENRATWLARARALDPDSPIVQQATDRFGRVFFDAGEAARERGAWEEAYRHYTRALRADPSLSWARRHAEEARAFRLAGDAGAS